MANLALQNADDEESEDKPLETDALGGVLECGNIKQVGEKHVPSDAAKD